MGLGGAMGLRLTAAGAETPLAVRWGNSEYANFVVGQTAKMSSHDVGLVHATATTARIDVEGTGATLPVARLSLPQQVGPLRLFVADTREATRLTAEKGFPVQRGFTQGAALLGASLADQPLLDPQRFVFPIDRSDGFVWSMEEDSHQFAFLSPQRSHEGIDINLHDARGYRRHALVAIEDATVRWIEQEKTQANEACVLLESAKQPGIFYIYQHLNRQALMVKAGMKVSRGTPLGYIWGDGVWGHLHFAVVGHGGVPTFSDRYRYLLNAFPALYELWHGDVQHRPRRHVRGEWIFDRNKAANGNRKYLGAYNALLGYGWHLEDFCPALKVESGPEQDPSQVNTSARLRRILFAGTSAAATNPRNHFVFQVDVEPGEYEVQVRVGDRDLPTWQKISINETPLGTYARDAGFTWTPLRTIRAPKGQLRLQVGLYGERLAAVSAFSFRRHVRDDA